LIIEKHVGCVVAERNAPSWLSFGALGWSHNAPYKYLISFFDFR